MWQRTVLGVLVVVFVIASWSSYQGRPGTVAADPQVRRGIGIWQANNCAACHQLYGLGGYMGPDLTNVFSTKGPLYISTFVRSGTGRMPAHPLTDTDMDALVRFLQWVDASGHAAVPDSAVHWSGTYILDP